MENDTIRLYIVRIPKGLEREEYIKLLEVLDDSKKKKILSFRKPEDRIRGLLADHLVRYLAMQGLGIENKDICYEYNKNGKPFIKGVASFNFNISHSGEYIACAMSSKTVGCDIQKKNPCDISMGNVIFTPKESQEIHSIDDFYKMWTLKEALLKAIGIGLSDEGIRINMMEDEQISEICYGGKKYFSKHFENALEGYSLSVWSEYNGTCKVEEIEYRKIIFALKSQTVKR